MKKEYQKPVVACTDIKKGKTISNSEKYEDKMRYQSWMTKGKGREVIWILAEKFRTNPEFIYREIAGEFVLIPSGEAARQSNGLAFLNKTGVFLWKLLEQERTLKQLSIAFAEEYELTEEQSLEDVTAFLELALTRKLIIRS